MEDPAPWTVLRLITWTTGHLTRSQIDQPRLSAELLLAHALGCKRLELYTRYDKVVAPDALAAFRELVKQSAGGQPIAYLVGVKEFYSLAFKVTPAVLIPRPETELLVDAAVEFAKACPAGMKHWDICTGSGCVAAAVAHYVPKATVLATDISPEAMAVAKENFARHKLDQRIRAEQADLLALPPSAGDLAPFDIITANPPYISDAHMAKLPQNVKREPQLALRAGPTGLDYIERIARDAPARLRPGGMLAMEIGFDQADRVHQLLTAAGQYEDIQLRRDQAGIDRMVTAIRKG